MSSFKDCFQPRVSGIWIGDRRFRLCGLGEAEKNPPASNQCFVSIAFEVLQNAKGFIGAVSGVVRVLHN